MDSSGIERELEELETRIERLRALYEQYFMGLERLEPQIPRKDVERRIWLLRREQIRNTGLRFKFQMLIQRYNTFQQYWGRVTREIENGTYRRDVVRAAQRVGAHETLTIVGRKRAEKYALLAEQQQQRADAKRAPEPAAPDDDDLDDAPTSIRTSHAAARSAEPPADLSDDAPTPAPASPAPATPAPASPVPKPKPLVGLGWGGIPKAPGKPLLADAPAQPRAPAPPAPASKSRRRVAELAAEMKAQRAARPAAEPPPEPPRAEPPAPPRAEPPAPPPKPPAAPARSNDLPEQRLRQIYDKYVATKRASNESTAGVTYERMVESLRAQAEKLRATNPAKSVDYEVVVKNGKTLLKPILK